MGKWPKYKIQEQKRKHQEIKKRMKSQINTSKDNDRTLAKIKEAISVGDQRKIISLAESLRNQGLLSGFVLTAEAYVKLGNIEGVEKTVEHAQQHTHKKVFFSGLLAEVYFLKKEFVKLMTLYEDVKNDPKTPVFLYQTMIKYFGVAGHFAKATEVLEIGLKRIGINLHYLYEEYIRSALGKQPNLKELFKFMRELHESGRISPIEVTVFMEVLYNKGMHDEVLRYYELYPKELLSNDTRITYFDALRKLGKHEKVLSEIDDFISSLSLLDPKNKNLAETIKAYCLTRIGRVTEAQELFITLLESMNVQNRNYARVLCGYIFTWPQITRENGERFKQILETRLKISENNEALCRDINDALERLRRFRYM